MGLEIGFGFGVRVRGCLLCDGLVLGPLQLLAVTRGAEDLRVHPWRSVQQRLAHDTRQDDGEGLG